MPFEGDDLQPVGVKQRHIGHRRLVVTVDENLEVGLEIEAVLMEKTGVQGIVAGHPLDKRCVEDDLFLRL